MLYDLQWTVTDFEVEIKFSKLRIRLSFIIVFF